MSIKSAILTLKEVTPPKRKRRRDYSDIDPQDLDPNTGEPCDGYSSPCIEPHPFGGGISARDPLMAPRPQQPGQAAALDDGSSRRTARPRHARRSLRPHQSQRAQDPLPVLRDVAAAPRMAGPVMPWEISKDGTTMKYRPIPFRCARRKAPAARTAIPSARHAIPRSIAQRPKRAALIRLPSRTLRSSNFPAR
jgi:hypothetical protein